MLKEIKNVISSSVFKESSVSAKETKRESIKLKSDTVNISPEAKRILQEGPPTQNAFLLKDINRDPLVREDKIAIAQERLSTSFYQNKTNEIVDLIFIDLFT